MIYQARAGQVAYGYAIGMLCAEWHIPFIPGDLNNAGTFPFPVRYESVAGVSGADVLRGNGDSYAKIMVDAAKKLEAEGVRAITGNCGFMASFQEEVASQVNIPVFLTSLVQIPMLLNMYGKDHHIAILTANSASLTDELLAGAGIAGEKSGCAGGGWRYRQYLPGCRRQTDRQVTGRARHGRTGQTHHGANPHSTAD